MTCSKLVKYLMPTAALDLATYFRITHTNRCFPRQVEEKGRRKGNENGECAVEVKLSTFFSFSLTLVSLLFLSSLALHDYHTFLKSKSEALADTRLWK